MGRIKTFVNGGTLLPGDLNAIQDDYENAFASYKSLVKAVVDTNVTTAATYLLADAAPFASVPQRWALYGFHLVPADLVGGSRATKYRLRVTHITNAVAPAITFTYGLYPVATIGGASGALPTIATLGSVVTGSTVAIASPGATLETVADSGDFTAPAAGSYALAVVLSGAAASGSEFACDVRLQARQV